MSNEEKRRILSEKCVAVYFFPSNISEDEVINVVTNGEQAVSIPDPSARKSDEQQCKWIVLLKDKESATKLLSEGFIYWKETQLKVEKIEVLCEIPDSWLVELDLTTSPFPSQQSPQEAESAVSNPPGPNQGPPGPNQGPPGPNQGPYQVPPGFQGYQGYTGGPGFYPGMYTGQGVPPGQEGFQNMPNVAQGFNYYMLPPMPPGMPYQLPQGPTDRQDQGSLGSVNKTEEAQHQGPFLPHFGFPQAYPGYFPYPQYPIGEDQQKMQGGVLPPPYEATMEKMPHGRSPMFNLDSSSESSKSSSTVMKHRSEESSSGITSESESSGRESEHQKPVEEIECKIIKVSNIPEGTTEDALTYFFENRRKSGGGPVEEVEFDESTLTAIITFEESNVVQRILGKLPILFNKKQITIEEFKPDMGDDVTTDDTETFPDGGFVIEVRGFKDSTSPDTIEMYFENKRRSGGGDIKHINSEKMEDGVVFIEFEEESVMESVLSKKHKIDGAHVEVIKYEPPPPPKPVPTYNNKVFIKNINPITSRDGLENFLEAKANAIPTDVVFRIEEGIALVTFEEEIDFEKLKLACQKKSLDKFYMKIQRVPITNCIIVKGFSERTSQDTLEFYFDNKRRSGGEGVLDVVMDKDEGFCIVSFEEPDVVDEVCKRKHKVEGCELDVRIHYQCLGQVVEEGRETSEEFHTPEPLVMKDVEVKKLEFLVQSESNRDALDKTVADLYGKIDWPKNRGQAKSNPFIVECTLTKEVKDYKKIARTWAKDVAAEVDKFLKLLVVDKHSTVHDAWSSVIDGLKSINVTKPDAVAVILEKNECEIFIVGYKHPVEDLSKQIIEIMGRVREEMDRRKERTKDVTKLKHFQVLYLQALKFGDEMLKNYRDFKVAYDIKKHSIMFEGLSGEIMKVKMNMFEIINGISKSDAGKFSKERQEFLKSTEVKNYVRDKFKENELIAVWEITDNQDHVNVYSKADEDAVKAAHVLKESVVESTIKIDKEASQLLSTPLWGRKMSEELENARGLASIIPHPQKLEITILCVDSTHGLVREFVEDFMRNNAIYQQSLTLSVGIMRFIQVQSGDEIRTIEESLQKDQVKIDISDDAITIQGTSVGLSKAKRKIDELVQTIELKKHSINKVGIGKHLQSSQGQERITKIEKSEGVVIEFSDDSDQSEEVLRQDKTFTSAQSKKELAVCLTSRAQKLIAVVCDMTELEADVLVNAANRDLKHIGGLAKVIVQKGGDVIQEECDRQIKSDRRLLEGEVFVSSPGSLSCKMIVHAVAPVWQNGRNNEEDYLREAVMKSMEEGSNRQLKSIAFPALSTGVFGYPARQATRVIVEALRDFFRECQDSSVDMVYLCDVKEDNVDLFVDGLMKTFGPDTVTDKRTGSGRKASHWHTSSKRTDGKSRGSQRSGQGISTGGGNVNIQVIKGQIARQQVDIIVNTTSKDLRLTNGAVSNSLLNAAGPSIQQECNMNYPNGVQHGQVAVTKGGNLRCSFVCHGSLPSWDSSGSSLRTLHQFMKSCLDVAHQRGMKSIAFPALGTGNLGYPKDIVAREMFSAVFKFTSSNTGSSISDVRFVLYEKDTATVKAFEFEEKRQSSGGGGGGGGRHNRQLNQGHGGDSGTRPKTGHGNYASHPTFLTQCGYPQNQATSFHTNAFHSYDEVENNFADMHESQNPYMTENFQNELERDFEDAGDEDVFNTRHTRGVHPSLCTPRGMGRNLNQSANPTVPSYGNVSPCSSTYQHPHTMFGHVPPYTNQAYKPPLSRALSTSEIEREHFRTFLGSLKGRKSRPLCRTKTNPNLKKMMTERWLPDDIIDMTMKMVKETFPHIQGLQDSCVIAIGGANGLKKHNRDFIQIINTAGNHWILVSNIDCPQFTVNVYDSCYRKLNADTRAHIVTMATPHPNGTIHVTMPPFQQQQNKEDCGLFAIAAMFTLAHGKNPSQMCYIDRKMRFHLEECLDEESCIEFPLTKGKRMLREKKYTLMVCRMCSIQPSDNAMDRMCVFCRSNYM